MATTLRTEMLFQPLTGRELTVRVGDYARRVGGVEMFLVHAINGDRITLRPLPTPTRQVLTSAKLTSSEWEVCSKGAVTVTREVVVDSEPER